MATVVVGVDGSEGSRRAVRFAAEEARLRGATLRAVLAWQYPVTLYESAGWVLPDPDMLSDFPQLARERLDRALAAETEALADVVVEPKVVEDVPAPALLEASKDADLLVVGTRGHGGFVGMVIGSVSQHCVHHSQIPVAVVPAG
jgi:nucleotide-binding universal stress UspA family protein